MNNIVILIVYSILLIICLCLSFVFSSADMAYGVVKLSRFDLELNKDKKHFKKISISKKLAKDYDNTIATITFGNDIVNACLDSVATLFGINLCIAIVSNSTFDLQNTYGLICSMVVLVLKITFGEILPKSFAKAKSYSFALAYSFVLNILTYIFFIFTKPVSMLGNGISKLFKSNVKDIELNEDDLHEMVDDIEESGKVDPTKADMLHDIINYTHKQANEIMTPRVDMSAIDIDDDIISLIKEGSILNHSRIPVYKGTIDNIIGFINTKSLLLTYISNKHFDITPLLIQPLRFPQSTEINDILREFKKEKKHFALIMDEYGGVDGIITMEDILEEIVGEIYDEADKTNEPIVERKDGSFIIDGNVTLDEFCQLFELDYDSINTDYVTIGGFIIELLDDKFAKVNDIVTLMDVEIKVIAIDSNNSIEKIIAKKV